jgi:hypothetical protein
VEVYIDIRDVPELRSMSSSTLGGNVTLTEAMRTFKVESTPGYEYLKEFAKHIDLVANPSVRNVSVYITILSLFKCTAVFIAYFIIYDIL